MHSRQSGPPRELAARQLMRMLTSHCVKGAQHVPASDVPTCHGAVGGAASVPIRMAHSLVTTINRVANDSGVVCGGALITVLASGARTSAARDFDRPEE